jgi:hypothetical protein
MRVKLIIGDFEGFFSKNLENFADYVLCQYTKKTSQIIRISGVLDFLCILNIFIAS